MASDKISIQVVNAVTNMLTSWEENYFEELKETYDESGFHTLFADYTRKVNIISAMVSCITLIISVAVNEMIFYLPFNRNILSSLAISMSFGTISLIIGHIRPAYQRSQNKSFLENNLIYSLSYMSCLASSGMPIERVFRRVGEVEDNPPYKALINRFLVNVNLLGLDILSALNQMADQSPSKNLAKITSSIRTTIMTSGDLKSLLLYEVDRQLQKKREVLKNSVNMLVYVGEIYVTMMVVTPVLFILMITILSIMGGIGGGAVVQLNLIIFFGIPVMTAAFIIILDQVLVIEE